MLLFILSALNFATLSSNSNTSHVIIYLLPLVKGQDPLSFKYISCYYLSLLSLQDIWRKMYSNTSHVIIYRLLDTDYEWDGEEFKYISCYYLSTLIPKRPKHLPHSNTSHVIIYRRKNTLLWNVLYIQIHLMLLFIWMITLFCHKAIYSNTSHVIIYRTRGGVKQNGICIQIHLMLLFIKNRYA